MTSGPASAELGIALDATERVGVLLGLATLGVNQDGQVPTKNSLTLPVPEFAGKTLVWSVVAVV